jgi:outer membrane receptor protein involved in Fe transport
MNWNSLVKSTRTHSRFVAVLFASALLPFGLTAQQASEAASEETDDLIELSPFEVESSKTIGYRATRTLAGTRIASDLKDVAASIFVFTPELMEDVGITNLQDAFMYGANTEGRDTYTSAGVGFTGRSQPFGAYSSSHGSPQSNQRVRGLTPADVSRGYYTSVTEMDAYNIEQATLLRGPNAIMFGLGSPAGIFNFTPKTAKLGRDANMVSFQFGKWGGTRTVVDFDKDLLEDELAVRVVGLYEDKRFMTQPAFEEDYRGFITTTWRPAQGRTNTTIRASFEKLSTEQNYPADVTMTDGYRRWLNAGGEGWDPTLNRSSQADCPDNVFDAAAGFCRDLNGDPLQIPFPSSLGTGRGNLAGGLTLFVNANDGNLRHSIDSSLGDFSINQQESNVGGNVTINGLSSRQGFVGTAGTYDGVQFEVEEGITDKNIWDWSKWSQNTTEGSRRANGSIFNFTVEQKLGENFYLEAGINVERVRIGHPSPTRGAKLHIDPNIVLPDGTTNPNYLRPAVVGASISITAAEQRDEYRLTGTYNLDLEERLAGWAGKHRLIGHYNNFEANIREFSGRDLKAGAAPNFINGPYNRDFSIRNGGVGSQTVVYYVGPETTTGQQPAASGPLNFDMQFFGGGVADRKVQRLQKDVKYFLNWRVDDAYAGTSGITQPPGTFLFADGSTDRATGTAYCVRDRSNKNYTTNCIPLMDGGVAKTDGSGNAMYAQMGGQDFIRQGVWHNDGTLVNQHMEYFDALRGLVKNEVETYAFISQSHLWPKGGNSDEHYGVVTVGYREDTVDSFSGPPVAAQQPKGTDGQYTGGIDVTPSSWVLNSEPVGATLNEATFSWGIVVHPLDVLDLHYNDSANFSAAGVRVNLYGEDMGPEKGSGEDYGFSLNLFKGKLSARVNFWEVNQSNVSAGGIQFIAFWRLNNLESVVKTRLTVKDDIRAGLDRSSENAPPPSGYPGRIAAIGASTNFSAEGNEIEVTYNPTPNLRIMVNAGRQRTTQSDIAPDIKRWIADRTAAWKGQSWYSRKGKEGTGPFGTGLDFENGAITWRNTLDETCPVGTSCTIEEWLNQIVNDPLSTQLVQEGRVNQQQPEWNFNAIANYTFSEGALDGFSVGSALRWHDTQVIGYGLATVAIDGVPTLTSDLDNPYIGDSDTYVDAWAAYTRPIMDGRATWKIQLNVRNLGRTAGLDPIASHLDGQDARWRIVNEMSWMITNTFKF